MYRVRAENYLADGNRIGWIQSFPLYVLAGRAAQTAYRSAHEVDDRHAREVDAPKGSRGGQPPTASQRFAWYPSVLRLRLGARPVTGQPALAQGPGAGVTGTTSPTGPAGSRSTTAAWAIESKRYNGPGPGDFGTTSATLRGNALTRGRWEVAMRIRTAFETGGRPPTRCSPS